MDTAQEQFVVDANGKKTGVILPVKLAETAQAQKTPSTRLVLPVQFGMMRDMWDEPEFGGDGKLSNRELFGQ